jgi:hypothetical protein
MTERGEHNVRPKRPRPYSLPQLASMMRLVFARSRLAEAVEDSLRKATGRPRELQWSDLLLILAVHAARTRVEMHLVQVHETAAELAELQLLSSVPERGITYNEITDGVDKLTKAIKAGKVSTPHNHPRGDRCPKRCPSEVITEATFASMLLTESLRPAVDETGCFRA